MTIEELYALKKEKVAAMRKLTEDNPETMDAESVEKFDALEAEVKNIDAQIKRKERVEAMSEDFEPQGRITTPTVPAKAKDHEEEARGGFQNLAEFALAVKASRHGPSDDRLKVLGAPSTTIHKEGGSDDGYMVPVAFRNEIFEVETSDFNILPLLDSEPTEANSVGMLADETTPWGATGIQAYWTSEAGQLTRSKLETKGKDVKLHKVHAFVEATEELLSDAPRLNARLTKGSNRAINWKLNQAVFEGDGTGKPLGFENSPSKIVVAKETGQAADSVVVKNISKMYRRSTNPAGSIWLINPSVLDELLELTVGNKPVYLPPTGITTAPGGFLFGRPVYFSEHAEMLGDESDIRFVDPKGYYMPNKGTIKASESMHLLFDYDVQCFKWTFRAGGMPYLSAPVTPNKGGAANSRSSYLVLGERA